MAGKKSNMASNVNQQKKMGSLAGSQTTKLNSLNGKGNSRKPDKTIMPVKPKKPYKPLPGKPGTGTGVSDGRMYKQPIGTTRPKPKPGPGPKPVKRGR